MKSILTPRAATSRATTPNDSAVIGRPRTTIVWVDGSRITGNESLRSIVTSRPTPWMASSTSWRSSAPPATSGGPTTRTPRVRRPRMTTCSTLRSSTLCADNTSNRADVTPGWSRPVTVINTDTLDMLIAACDETSTGLVHRLGRVVFPTDVGLRSHPIHHVRVVQLEGRPLRPDAGQLGEVLPRRGAPGRPLQRGGAAPRIVDHHRLAVAPALAHVPREGQRRDAKDERADRRHDVQRGEPVGGQVVGVAARHAFVAQPVLHQKRGVKADERQPEMQLPQPLVEQPARHLGEPEVDARVGGEHNGAEKHVMEMRH